MAATAGRQGLLAGGRRRRDLRLRRRRLLRLDRQHPRSMPPIVLITATRDGAGYLLTAADGGIFAFGDARFYGSLGAVPQAAARSSPWPTTLDGGGYWFINTNGAVTAFGDATYWGSAPQCLAAPDRGHRPGHRERGPSPAPHYPSGSYGYDISNYQCGDYPPAPHTVGIVQVVGASFGSVNPCLAGEAAWAGGRAQPLRLPDLRRRRRPGDRPAPSSCTNSCNFGFNAGVDAYAKAQAAGINTQVPWWLDVEDHAGIPLVHQPGGQRRRSSRATSTPSTPRASTAWASTPVPGCGGIVGQLHAGGALLGRRLGAAPRHHVHRRPLDVYPGLPTGPVQMVQYGVGAHRSLRATTPGRPGLRLLSPRCPPTPTRRHPRPARLGDRVRRHRPRRPGRGGGPRRCSRQLPRAAVDLPGGERGVLGAQLHPGPVEAADHRQLGQQRGLDHPGVARPPPPAGPGGAAATASRASDTRLTNPVQLSPPGAMGRSGIGVPVRVAEPGAERRAQSRPSASPGWSSQNPHSWTGARAAPPSPGRPGPGPAVPAVSTARGRTLE